MSSVEISSPDVDKGWAIVVMLLVFLTNIVTLGLTYTGSIFYVLFLDEFEESPVLTSWAINVNYFCTLAGGIIASCVFHTVGARIAIIIGCLMTCIGLISCSFTTNVMGVLSTYGVVTGIGNALVLLAAYASMPTYFKKYRILAYTISSVGTGLGKFINPPMIRYLMDLYHWRGALIVLAGINLNTLITAAVLIPPRQVTDISTEQDVRKKETNSLKVKGIETLKKLRKGLTVFSFPIWYPFCIGRVALTIGFGGFQTHIMNFGRRTLIDSTTIELTFLPSLIGIGSVTGRLVIGSITQIIKVHPVFSYMLIFSCGVIANIGISFTDTYASIAACAFVAGLAFGGNALINEVCLRVSGVDLYPSTVGYVMACDGIGLLLGGPLAAWLYELDPTYVWAFRIIGMIAFTGVILSLPIWLTYEKGRFSQRLSQDEKNNLEKYVPKQPAATDKA